MLVVGSRRRKPKATKVAPMMQTVVDRATGPMFSPDSPLTMIAQTMPLPRPLISPAYESDFRGRNVATTAMTVPGRTYAHTAEERIAPK